MFMSIGAALNSFPFEPVKLWMNVKTDQLVLSHWSIGGQILEYLNEAPFFYPMWMFGGYDIAVNPDFVYIGEFD